MKSVVSLLVVPAVVVLHLSGCSACDEERSLVGISSLNDNVEKWDGLGINTYVMNYSQNGSFLPPSSLTSNRVVVESGEIVQVDILNSNGQVIEQVSSENFSAYFLAENLFDEIRALNSQVKDLEVQYSQETGLPSSIFVDPNLGVDGCGDVSDDEFTITAGIEF